MWHGAVWRGVWCCVVLCRVDLCLVCDVSCSVAFCSYFVCSSPPLFPSLLLLLSMTIIPPRFVVSCCGRSCVVLSCDCVVWCSVLLYGVVWCCVALYWCCIVLGCVGFVLVLCYLVLICVVLCYVDCFVSCWCCGVLVLCCVDIFWF